MSSTPEIDAVCPMCGAETYVCEVEHVDGRSYRHCRQFSTHNFAVEEAS
jgi:hypothetical protein